MPIAESTRVTLLQQLLLPGMIDDSAPSSPVATEKVAEHIRTTENVVRIKASVVRLTHSSQCHSRSSDKFIVVQNL